MLFWLVTIISIFIICRYAYIDIKGGQLSRELLPHLCQLFFLKKLKDDEGAK